MSCSTSSETVFSSSPEKAYLIISNNTTEDELKSIALELKENNNIDFDASGSEYNPNGSIKSFNFTIDCNDGYKGKAKIAVSNFNTNKSGFIRDYSENAATPFKFGSMESVELNE